MLNSAQQLVQSAADILDLDDEERTYVLKPQAEHSFDISLSNGNTYRAFRVQHNNALGPFKGGVRFHSDVDIDEVRALALLMSLKTAAVGLTLGGGKGGVSVNPKQLSKSELEELSRSYAQHLADVIGPDVDVPAPDVNTNAQIIDWMVDAYEQVTGDTSHASFTGKSIERGGSEGRVDATGRGGAIALSELLQKRGEHEGELTYAVQGFGNVGQYFATSIAEFVPAAKLVAISDSSATICNSEGFDVHEIADFKSQGGSFKDYEGPAEIKEADAIIGHDVDVLVFAALGDVIQESNQETIKSRYILELANGPVNDAAHDQLTQKGITIIPDIIANAGGVIVSYFEWLQNKNNEHWNLERVHQELENYMVKAMDTVQDLSQDKGVSLKEAAAVVAIKRIIKARNKEE